MTTLEKLQETYPRMTVEEAVKVAREGLPLHERITMFAAPGKFIETCKQIARENGHPCN